MGKLGQWGFLVAVVLCVATACDSAAGSSEPMPVVGETQRIDNSMLLDVTPLVFVDPAPVYQRSERDEVDAGTRLVAVRLRVTNRAPHDELVGPGGLIGFHGDNGKVYGHSFTETSAGVMFEHAVLATGQSMVGYYTAEIPENVRIEAVEYEAGYRPSTPLKWAVVETVDTVPAPPARVDDGVEKHALGTKVEIAGDREGVEVRLEVAAAEVVDPAEGDIDVNPDRRLFGVRFTVHNSGGTLYDDEESGFDLRDFAVHNVADEIVQSHPDGVSEVKGLPLGPGSDDTWTVLFEVPTDFVVDRVSFAPTFGDTVATVWTVT